MRAKTRAPGSLGVKLGQKSVRSRVRIRVGERWWNRWVWTKKTQVVESALTASALCKAVGDRMVSK